METLSHAVCSHLNRSGRYHAEQNKPEEEKQTQDDLIHLYYIEKQIKGVENNHLITNSIDFLAD